MQIKCFTEFLAARDFNQNLFPRIKLIYEIEICRLKSVLFEVYSHCCLGMIQNWLEAFSGSYLAEQISHKMRWNAENSCPAEMCLKCDQSEYVDLVSLWWTDAKEKNIMFICSYFIWYIYAHFVWRCYLIHYCLRFTKRQNASAYIRSTRRFAHHGHSHLPLIHKIGYYWPFN